MKANPKTAFLALGSNVGDRAANLRRAVSLLEMAGVKVAAKSKIYLSQSVEGGGDEDFLNAVLRVETRFSPLELLHLGQQIEAMMGRPAPPRQGERTIDVDVLIYENERLETPELTLPHPRLHLRPFVLKPLLDVLEGGWIEESNEDWS